MGSFVSRNKQFEPATDVPDLTGKVAIVTGGNSGMGFRAVQQLARKGAKVYMAARNESRATGAISQLEAEGLGPGNGKVEWLKLDLSDPKQSNAAAEEILSKEKTLDILVNNAGIQSSPWQMNPVGIQETMVVNHFSPYIFTKTLMPLLTSSAQAGHDVRIVNVTSMTVALVPSDPHFRTKEDYNFKYEGQLMDGLKRYGKSKLANMLWANELQRQFDAQSVPVICMSVDPGGVITEGSVAVTNNNIWLWIIFNGSRYFMHTAEQGGHSITFPAASPVVRANPELYKGALLKEMKVSAKPKMGQDKALGKELTESTEELLKEMGL
ncbi:NAD-P-binding protein [Rickenella mellea]|uniref:NAD-P-binding protein n=1 Tax=Rickenella mellea TaxID=50990 RepID=A0A4Y7PRD6_9AGAM|nr:NAD-P-binding protein [Rickenella mellea]